MSHEISDYTPENAPKSGRRQRRLQETKAGQTCGTGKVMQQPEVENAARQPLPTSPEEQASDAGSPETPVPDHSSKSLNDTQVTTAENVSSKKDPTLRVAVEQQDLEHEPDTQIVGNGVVRHEKVPSVTEIPPPSPPPLPAKTSEESLDVPNVPNESASLQEIPLDQPPPPVEKSPPPPPPNQIQHAQSTERVQSPRPGTPITARIFGRKSTSESLPSPSMVAGHNRSLTMSKGNTVSVVLISSALETIAASREAKRSAPLKEAVDNALNMIRAGQGGDKPREIFEPLRLACETGNEKLQVASLDCISKLISYSFFLESGPSPGQHAIAASPPASPVPNTAGFAESQTNLRPPNLVDIVTHTITTCHTETAADTVSLQIVKALLSLVLSPVLLVHQSSLLKAVRTVYNIFLMSSDPVNQTVAQGGLTQMVHHVFSRCKRINHHSDYSGSSAPQSPKLESTSFRSKPSSKRPSLTPSTPDTYPLPPLTPPNDGNEELSPDAKERHSMETAGQDSDRTPSVADPQSHPQSPHSQSPDTERLAL